MEQFFSKREEKYKIEKIFERKGTLTGRKLREYVPVMILTNMSVFVMATVDGVVAGNLVSSQALSSINVFYPAMVIITIISALVESGAATSLATCMGKNDVEAIRRTKAAVRLVMIGAAIFTALIQFPIIYGVINSYNLSPEVRDMAWQYAAGIMIAMPFGLVSSVSSYQLQIVGKMRILMILSITEGVLNTLFDIFFASTLHMGIAGIGYGTAAATVIRCLITIIYITAKTDIYRCRGVKVKAHEVRDILRCGCPDAANMMMLAIQNYFVMMIIIAQFGDVGGTIKGVLFFTFNIANIVILGIMSSMRPLVGLYSGARDTTAMRNLLQQCFVRTVIFVGLITIIVELFPTLFYHLNGVTEMPNGGVLSLRLFALYFVFKGVDALFRLYFANRKDTLAATGLTILGNATLPVFAFSIAHFLSTPFLWLGYLMMELLIFGLSMYRYLWWLEKDRKESGPTEKVLHLSVRPEEAVEASRQLRRFADENGYPERIAYRMALCMEEMVGYVVQSQKRSEVSIMIMARFSPEEGTFCMIDDGHCIALNEDHETEELITDNYELLKKVAKSVEYQYILNMNYTIFRF